MKSITRLSRITSILAVAVLFAVAVPAMFAAQTNSNVSTVPVNVTVGESLTIAVSGGPFTIPGTSSTASNMVTVNVSYNLNPSQHTSGIATLDWLDSATAALVAGSVNVPSSALSVSANGSPFVACTGAPSFGFGVAGAVCFANTQLNQAALTATPVGSFSDTYQIEYTTNLQAGSYTGNWNVVYVAP